MIENYRPGVMRGFGLDYPSLAAEHPALIYASISGYGQTGPDASKGGFDLIAQGVSGLMSVTGRARPAAGQGWRAPDRSRRRIVRAVGHARGAPLPQSDRPRPAYRHLAGRGRHRAVGLGIGAVLRGGRRFPSRSDPRTGCSPRIRRSAAPTATSRSDRRTTVSFSGSATLLGHPEWTSEPDFANDTLRVRNRVALADRIEAITVAQPASTGSGASRRRVFRAGRSTITPRRSPTRRSARAAWSSRSTIRHSGGVQTPGSPIKMSETPTGRRAACAAARPAHTRGAARGWVLGCGDHGRFGLQFRMSEIGDAVAALPVGQGTWC